MKTTAISALVLSALIAACSSHRDWTTVDRWYAPASSGIPYGSELPDTLYFEVPEDNLPSAEQRLINDSYRALTLSETTDLLGKRVYGPPGTHPYLVRAVYLNKETGGYAVLEKGGNVYVEHQSLGKTAVPMKRSAVIVILPQEPRNVFVSCHMAE